MNKKVVKPLFLLGFAFCLAFLPPLATFAEEDILGGSDEEILNDCENAINVWSESKLRRYAEDNILYYDDQFEENCGSSSEEPEPENPCGTVIITGDNAKSIASSLRSAGYSDTSVAAILGNLQAESGLEPRKFEGGKLASEDFVAYQGGQKTFSGGFGIAQWTSEGRVKNLQDYADSHNLRVTSLEAQIGYLLQELGNAGYKSTPGILNGLSLEDATFQVGRYYEGPAGLIYSTHNGTYYNDFVPSSRSQLDETRTPSAYKEWKKRYEAAQAFLGTPTEDGTGECSEPIPTELTPGGMTLSEARAWMENNYRSLARDYLGSTESYTPVPGKGTIYYAEGCHDTLNNCSAFSAWFVNVYTSASTKGISIDGDDIATNLINSNQGFKGANGTSKPGTTPAVYAIFSHGNDSSGKHTGVILGIDTERNKIIVGEASCHNGFTDRYPNANEYDLSRYLSGYRYAYTDDILQGL